MADSKEAKWVQVSDHHWRRVTRRELLRIAAAGAAAATVWRPYFNLRAWAQGRRLTFLHWSHFVPGFDKWFDGEYTKEWGKAHDVEVVVDHIPSSQIAVRAAAEVAAQKGHDLYQFITPAPNFEPELEDMSDLVEPFRQKYGIVELARRSTYNPKTKKWFALSLSFTPDPAHYRKDAFDAVGFVPDSWDNLLRAGRKLKAMGLPIGIAISGCIDSNMALRDALWSHGSSIQNETGEVVINNKNTVETIKYIRALFKEAMDPEVLAWDDSSNNRAMEGGKISWTLNAISIARSIEKNNPDFFPKVQLWKPPRGPRNLGGKRLGSEHVFFSYAIWKFTPPEQKQLAKQFLVDYANNWGRAFVGSEFYEFPSFPGTVPNLKDQILHDGVAAKMGQPEKYKELTSALDWSTNVGFPGYANAAEGEVFDTYILPQMFALAATDRMSPEDAAKWAEAQIAPIFAKWKARGLM